MKPKRGDCFINGLWKKIGPTILIMTPQYTLIKKGKTKKRKWCGQSDPERLKSQPAPSWVAAQAHDKKGNGAERGIRTRVSTKLTGVFQSGSLNLISPRMA